MPNIIVRDGEKGESQIPPLSLLLWTYNNFLPAKCGQLISLNLWREVHCDGRPSIWNLFCHFNKNKTYGIFSRKQSMVNTIWGIEVLRCRWASYLNWATYLSNDFLLRTMCLPTRSIKLLSTKLGIKEDTDCQLRLSQLN